MGRLVAGVRNAGLLATGLATVLTGLVVAGTPAATAASCGASQVAISDVEQYESNGPTYFAFHVSATASPGCTPVGRVAFHTTDGSAVDGGDYTAVSGVLEWTATSATSKWITVPVVGDVKGETDEEFSVELVADRGMTLLDPVGKGLIINDDPHEKFDGVDFQINGKICWDPHDVCYVPVKVSTPVVTTVSLRFSTIDGTAIAGRDYVGVEKATAYAERGAEVVWIPITLLEPVREAVSFVVMISHPSAGTISQEKAEIIIKPAD